jgi:hypothetical protein
MKKIKMMLVFLCIAIPFFGLSSASGQQRDIAGTYEVILCSGDCNFDEKDHVIVKGYFVFFNQPIDKETLKRQWANFDTQFSVNPTACFSLEPLKGSSRTFAGIIRNGTTAWSQSKNSDAIEFPVYASADGSCKIVGESTGKLFRGKATTRHMGETISVYSVTARWIADPDVKYCVQ